MRLSFALYACSFLAATPAVAQLGIYGTFNAERLSQPSSSSATYGPLIPTNPIGGTGGIYYDFRKIGPVLLGADVRGSIVTTRRGAQANSDGAGARINSVLGGVRGSFRTPIEPLKPYVQFSAGLGRSDYGLYGPTLYNGFEYHIFAGLDVRLSSLLDLRAVEIGYGGLTGAGPASGTYPLKSVGVGVVFHLPSLP